MSHAFPPEVSDRICKHMNQDHADAVVQYAQAFGGMPEATAATLLAIDPEGMDLQVELPDGTQPLRIAFDHTLVDAKDAHHTLVAMIRQLQN
jgi:putative heme iron utilization protein